MDRLQNKFDFDAAANAFYGSLFTLFPEIEARFRHVTAQKQMFEIALKTVIKNIQNDEELDRYLKLLGEKHKMMGIQPMHMTRGYTAFVQAIKAGYPDITSEHIVVLTEIYKKLIISMGYKADGLKFG